MSVAFLGPYGASQVPYSHKGGNVADDLDRDGMENQAKGAGKQAEGRIRNAVGGITGDSEEQLRGKTKELEGKAQRKIGETESDLSDDR
jgi:uncharacterized protein YjbJ (UPF0337 family)